MDVGLNHLDGPMLTLGALGFIGGAVQVLRQLRPQLTALLERRSRNAKDA